MAGDLGWQTTPTGDLRSALQGEDVNDTSCDPLRGEAMCIRTSPYRSTKASEWDSDHSSACANQSRKYRTASSASEISR